MQSKPAISLRLKVLTLIAAVVLIAFTVTIGVLTHQASTQQTDANNQYAEQLARTHGKEASARIEVALNAARTMANTLRGIHSAGLSNRTAADAMLKSVLEGDPRFLGVWTCWEPNAFDGKDAAFADKPGHDATGRYIPYWNRGGGSIALEALVDYDKIGAGDYYLLAKQSGDETLIEPYSYKVAGKDTLLTSVAVPIKVDGVFVGVVGIDLTLGELEQTVGTIRPYETGYASLISNSGLYLADVDAKNIGKSMGDSEQEKAAKDAIKAGLTHQRTFFSEPLQTMVRSVYVPVQIGGTKAPWSFSTTVPQDKVMAGIYNLRYTAIALGLVSVLAVSLGLHVLITRLVLRPLGGEPNTAAAIALRVASGNLSGAIELTHGDTASLMAQLKHMQDKLAHIVSNVRINSDCVASASAEIAEHNQQLSTRTEGQATALQQTSASMEELSITVQQNSDNAQQAKHLALNASTIAVQGGNVVAQVVDTMKGISDSSHKISDIIGVIDSIAFQTNILALNAAVEAARAGEQGRGFAVVASEVRLLAGRSAEAAKEIKQLIGDSEKHVGKGSELAGRAGKTMTEVVTSIQRVADIVSEISAASSDQTLGVGQVRQAVSEMDDATRQNAALVEQMAAATTNLHQQSNALVHAMSAFSLGDEHDAMPATGLETTANRFQHPQLEA